MDSFEAQYHSLFRRCVQGCGTEVPACNCAADQICNTIIQTCDACATVTCIASPVSSSTGISSGTTASKPNVGAIAGGVIGGVLIIATATYLVWRFCIKPRRQQFEQEDWTEHSSVPASAEKDDFTMQRDARASTHTVASLASTVLTRASNIIQIAYIPGVTNRSAPSTPGLLVPPVPPIPIALSSSPSSPYEHEHFFMPGDLRDSTYSGMTDRTSYARNSVASTIYGKNAMVSPVPAQTIIRGKAAVVSVNSKGPGSNGELTPPVPSVNYSKYSVNGPPSPAFSVGSTFLNSAATQATQVRPQVVRVVNTATKKKPDSFTSAITDDDDTTQSGSLLIRDSNAITIIDDTPAIEQGPFADPPNTLHDSSSSLSAIIEEAAKKSKGKGLATPFGDEHELKE